jgi:hypothetical protein
MTAQTQPRCGGVIGGADHAREIAGQAFARGEYGLALDYLSIARTLAPERAIEWDQLERRTRHLGGIPDDPKPCSAPGPGHDGPARPYPQGWRCAAHPPQAAYPVVQDAAMATACTGEACPCCGTAALASGRATCQACGALEAIAAAPQRAPEYPDLSHGQPGHMCVLPGAVPAAREAEAGS